MHNSTKIQSKQNENIHEKKPTLAEKQLEVASQPWLPLFALKKNNGTTLVDVYSLWSRHGQQTLQNGKQVENAERLTVRENEGSV